MKKTPKSIWTLLCFADGSQSRLGTGSIKEALEWLVDDISSCERDAIDTDNLVSITFIRDKNEN